MAIAPLFQEQLAAAELRGEQRGEQQGIERGRREENRLILENFLQVRFGELEAKVALLIAPLSALSAAELTRLLVQLSALPVDENGVRLAQELLAESVLRMRFELFDERLANLVPSLLGLSVEDLAGLLLQLPQLSVEELLEKL